MVVWRTQISHFVFSIFSGICFKVQNMHGARAIATKSIRKLSERGPRWSWTLLVHQEGLWFPWSTWSTPIHSDPHFLKFYRKCGLGWIRVDQEDQGDHNPPWWARTGFYILLIKPINWRKNLQCNRYRLLVGFEYRLIISIFHHWVWYSWCFMFGFEFRSILSIFYLLCQDIIWYLICFM